MTTQAPGIPLDPRSPLGYGLSCTYCTVVLPFPDGSGGTVQRAVTTIQPPLGIGTNPKTGRVLPSCTSGRPLLAESLIRRLSCRRGGLVDTKVPTTTAQYGIQLLDYIAADMGTGEVGQLSAAIDAQMTSPAEDRVISSTTSGALIGSTLIESITITDGQGPFRLTIAIDLLVQDFSVLSSP